MTEEKYLIGDKEFTLRDDLSLNELEIVEEFTNPFKAVNKTTISGGKNHSFSEVKKIIKIILKPVDGSNKEDIDWGQLTQDQCVLILADYIKKKAQENIIMTELSKSYERELLKHSAHITT